MSRSSQSRLPLWKILCVALPAILVGVFAYGLTRDPSHIPSALIGKPAPDFALSELEDGRKIKLSDYTGKVMMINFWASWCGACRTEHDTLVKLSGRFSGSSQVALLGVNYRDRSSQAVEFLQRHGAFNYPSVVDARGRTGIDFGVYGLPETYFVDQKGRIAYRHIGPIEEGQALKVLAELGVVQ